jgi:hypothetical protein
MSTRHTKARTGILLATLIGATVACTAEADDAPAPVEPVTDAYQASTAPPKELLIASTVRWYRAGAEDRACSGVIVRANGRSVRIATARHCLNRDEDETARVDTVVTERFVVEAAAGAKSLYAAPIGFGGTARLYPALGRERKPVRDAAQVHCQSDLATIDFELAAGIPQRSPVRLMGGSQADLTREVLGAGFGWLADAEEFNRPTGRLEWAKLTGFKAAVPLYPSSEYTARADQYTGGLHFHLNPYLGTSIPLSGDSGSPVFAFSRAGWVLIGLVSMSTDTSTPRLREADVFLADVRSAQVRAWLLE